MKENLGKTLRANLNKRKFSLIILLGLVIMSLSLSACTNYSQQKDLKDISSNLKAYKLISQSERGFGNDRCDVYSFSLENPDNVNEFVSESNDAIASCLNSALGICKNGMDEIEYKQFKEDISKVLKTEDIKYLYINTYEQYPKTEALERLYIYSQSINQAYCFIIVI